MPSLGHHPIRIAVRSILRRKPKPAKTLAQLAIDGGLDAKAREEIGDTFDANYYVGANPDIAAIGIDPLEHYFAYGWRERRNPSPQFDTSYYLDSNPELLESDTNPLLHWVQVGRREGLPSRDDSNPPPDLADFREETRTSAQDPSPVARVSDATREVVGNDFDELFYRKTYPDLDHPDLRAIDHYFTVGWTEGRNPSAHFNTAYYLDQNPDVRALGTNPLLHYVNMGRDEGRLARPPIRPEIKATLEQARQFLSEEAEEHRSVRAVFARTHLNLKERLASAFSASKGRVVLSFGHDKYSENCGGIQILISDEQRLFNEEGIFYLNLSPANPNLALSRLSESNRFFVNLTADGEVWGAVTIADLREAALDALAENDDLRVVVIIHSLLGHNVGLIQELCEAIENPTCAIFWIHDYFSLCPSYNLMRNDVAYCDAPPVDSPACGICSYGDRRRDHLRQMARLFDALPFTVVAPSESALDVWRSSSNFRVNNTVVHPHIELDFTSKRVKFLPEPAENGGTGLPLKVGFCGYPVLHKGWYVCQELIEAPLPDNKPFSFYHFAERSNSGSQLRFRNVRVTREDREAIIKSLRANDLDVVVIPALWPETFCYVAHEAVAAGCIVVTLESSGNVKALAKRLDQGIVYKDEKDLIEAFIDGSLYTRVSKMLADGVNAAEINYTGTSATMDEVAE